MPAPNVLDLVGDIRDAVERLPRDQLVDILVYVFKEYVVEGPAPLAAGPTPFQDELAGMSFAEVIRSLQLRLELPELELFDVQADRVTVRLQGRALPIELGTNRADPPSPAVAPQTTPAAVTAAPEPAAPAASTASRTASQQSPAAAQQIGSIPSSPTPAAPAATQQSPAAAPRAAGLLEID